MSAAAARLASGKARVLKATGRAPGDAVSDTPSRAFGMARMLSGNGASRQPRRPDRGLA